MHQLPQAYSALLNQPRFVAAKIEARIDNTTGLQAIKPGTDILSWNKKPWNIETNLPLKWSLPENKLSFDNALNIVAALQTKYPDIRWDIGWVHAIDDNHVFLDLDWARSSVDILSEQYPFIDPWGWPCSPIANDLFLRFPKAAIAVSSSGTGYHINFVTSQYVFSRTLNSVYRLEAYICRNKFQMGGRPDVLGDCNTVYDAELYAFLSAYQLDKESYKTTGSGDILTEWNEACLELPHEHHTQILSDDEVVDRMIRAACPFGIGARTLYHGSLEGYGGNASSATAALATHFCFWTGNDAPRIERLMQGSPAAQTDMGAKWERWDILPRAILFARGVTHSFYNSGHRTNSQAQSSATSSNSQAQPSAEVRNTSDLRFRYPEQTANNKIINSTTNLNFLLRSLHITARWNDMKHERELVIPNFTPHRGDAQNATLCRVTDIAAFHEYPITRIDEQLTLIAQRDTYHPLVECIAQRPWDGIPRLQAFIDCIQTADPSSQHLIRKWMMSTMGGVHSPTGWSQQGVLVLQGKQGIQKTRLIKSLDPINCGAVKEGAILDPNNKDNVITLSKHSIVEIAELDGTLRKNDVARLKAFITTDADEVRFPYARKNTILPRRTSYIATVNDFRFLNDTTGNRRFHVVTVENINLDHGLDMQQIWAEVEYYRLGGEMTWLTKEESDKLNITNEKYEQLNILEEKVLDYFDWTDDWKDKPMLETTCSKVLNLLGVKADSNSLATRMSYVLKKHGLVSTKHRHYFLPMPKKSI
jgi:putative DNA primase/helicase